MLDLVERSPRRAQAETRLKVLISNDRFARMLVDFTAIGADHFLAQIRTAGRPTVPLLEHCASLSPMSVDTPFAPQNAEIAISSAAQPSGHPPDPQSIRRILLPDSPGPNRARDGKPRLTKSALARPEHGLGTD